MTPVRTIVQPDVVQGNSVRFSVEDGEIVLAELPCGDSVTMSAKLLRDTLGKLNRKLAKPVSLTEFTAADDWEGWSLANTGDGVITALSNNYTIDRSEVQRMNGYASWRRVDLLETLDILGV